MCILMTDHRRAGGDVKECPSEQGVYKYTEVFSPRVTLQYVVDGCFLCTWASKQSTCVAETSKDLSFFLG